MKLQVLGSDSEKSTQLARRTQEVADEIGIDYEIEIVRDAVRFAEYGVMITPSLVIDGKVFSAGSLPSRAELREALTGH